MTIPPHLVFRDSRCGFPALAKGSRSGKMGRGKFHGNMRQEQLMMQGGRYFLLRFLMKQKVPSPLLSLFFD
jgi:hypothetical protein